jgi:DNA-directed RNA polymerase subunit M/transcription elongation factor TFIIS
VKRQLAFCPKCGDHWIYDMRVNSYSVICQVCRYPAQFCYDRTHRLMSEDRHEKAEARFRRQVPQRPPEM